MVVEWRATRVCAMNLFSSLRFKILNFGKWAAAHTTPPDHLLCCIVVNDATNYIILSSVMLRHFSHVAVYRALCRVSSICGGYSQLTAWLAPYYFIVDWTDVTTRFFKSVLFELTWAFDSNQTFATTQFPSTTTQNKFQMIFLNFEEGFICSEFVEQ